MSIPSASAAVEQPAASQADSKADIGLSESLLALALHSPSPADAGARGVQTTQSLSSNGCAALEQYAGVTLATIHAKDGSQHLYLMHGVFYQELQPLSVPPDKPFHKPHHDFAFCIYSSDEFLRDVCEQGHDTIYWPRTRRFYSIPDWYRQKIATGLAAFRSASHQ